MKGHNTRLRCLEDSLEHMGKALLLIGGEAIDEWAKFKATQIEETLVTTAKNGWLKNSVVKDPLFKSYLPTRYEEATVVLLNEQPGQPSQQSRDSGWNRNPAWKSGRRGGYHRDIAQQTPPLPQSGGPIPVPPMAETVSQTGEHRWKEPPPMGSAYTEFIRPHKIPR